MTDDLDALLAQLRAADDATIARVRNAIASKDAGRATSKEVVATNVLVRYVAWNKSVGKKGYFQFAFDVLASDAKDAQVQDRVVWQHYTGLDKLPEFFNYVKPGALYLASYGVKAEAGSMRITTVVNGQSVVLKYTTRNVFTIAKYTKPKA